jgi:hypothetical protein
MPTESQLRDTALRLRVRHLIDNARLPVILPGQINAGYGSAHICDACDQPIIRIQIEYEVEDYREGRRLRFHFGCHVGMAAGVRSPGRLARGRHSLPGSEDPGKAGAGGPSGPLKRMLVDTCALALALIKEANHGERLCRTLHRRHATAS